MRKFSLSVLETQQSPGQYEIFLFFFIQKLKTTDTINANVSTNGFLQTCAHVTLRAAADVVPADLSERLFVLSGSVGATAAVI